MNNPFVSNWRILALAISLLIVAGLSAVHSLPRTEDPRMSGRLGFILTHLKGASAEQIEVQLSTKIENKLREIPEIKHIYSWSHPDYSIVAIKLKEDIYDEEANLIWSRVRDYLSDLSPSLPKSASFPKLETDRWWSYTMLIALKWNADGEPNQKLLSRHADELYNRLRATHGTDKVKIYGQQMEEIHVDLKPQEVAALQITSEDVGQLIRSADTKKPSGLVVNRNNQLQIDFSSKLDSIQRLQNLPVKVPKSQGFVYLSDIATVSRALRQPLQPLAIVHGNDAIVVAVRMLPGERVDRWTKLINNKLAQFNQQLADDIQTEVIFSQDVYTEGRLGDLINNILIGFSIILLVLFFTLGWRTAILVSLSLPFSVLFALSCMHYYGLPIHQMSVTGLVVALGIAVDNAIVMSDEIVRRLKENKSTLAAVNGAIAHLWVPLLSSTLTTILAFMPMVLMDGPTGEFVGGIALSVIFALLGSYVISHTIVAGLVGRYMSGIRDKPKGWYTTGVHSELLAAGFRKCLRYFLDYPKFAIILTTSVAVIGYLSIVRLPEQFFSSADRNMFLVDLYLSDYSNILNTKKTAIEIDNIIKAQENVVASHWFVGQNVPTVYYNMYQGKEGSNNFAQAMVTTTTAGTADELIPQLQTQLEQMFPEAQIIVRKLEQGPGFDAPVEIRLVGPDLDTLYQKGEALRSIIAETPGVTQTKASLSEAVPKLVYNVDEFKALNMDLPLAKISAQLRNGIDGSIYATVFEDVQELPVRVKIARQNKHQNILENFNFYSSALNGEGNGYDSVSSMVMGTMSLQPETAQIARRNGERINNVQVFIDSNLLPSGVLKNIKKRIKEKGFQVDDGYRIEFGGEGEERSDAVKSVKSHLGVIVVLLIVCIVFSFNSFRLSSIIGSVAILSIGLGILSVYLFGYPFSFTVIIGLMGLMGLAINAAIVIIAELKSNADACRGDEEAIISGIMKCSRHIISTTITTVGGFTPLLIGGGGFWPPFAIAIMGGTVLTTLLSFIFVPATFLLFANRRAFVAKYAYLPMGNVSRVLNAVGMRAVKADTGGVTDVVNKVNLKRATAVAEEKNAGTIYNPKMDTTYNAS